MSSSSIVLSSVRLSADTLKLDAHVSFNKEVAFNQYASFYENASFRNSATFYPDGVFETTSIDDRGLRTSNRFALYAGSLREALYPHLEILSETDSFLVTTKNDGPGGFNAYPMNFAAKKFGFEGNSISLKELYTDSTVINLSGDGTVSAGALALRGAGGKDLTAKFDANASAWNLEGSSSLNVNTAVNFSSSANFSSSLSVNGEASFFGDQGQMSTRIESEGLFTTKRIALYAGSLRERLYPHMEILYDPDASGNNRFFISTRNESTGGYSYFPLHFIAQSYNFEGGNLNLRKRDSDTTMIRLIQDGTVKAGALTLRPGGVDSGKNPTLEIQYNGEESAWNLGATGDSATAPLNVKVSKLNVDGPIVCKDQMKVAQIEAQKMRVNDVTVNMDHAADYVFDENYDLKSLDEVEAFVKENKHLPGVPSASKMKEEGMSLSEMSNLLLEKVEELTLHLIRVEKENRALKAEMERMRNEK
ncbi:MAG: hypothetical protein IKP27_05280 [Paludibacteraceae bacterium]|nr:hypothetical protein [Paludibacteraceae bacterium]